MKISLRLYGSILKFSSSYPDLFIQKGTEFVAIVSNEDGKFLLWYDEIPSKYKPLGNIVAVEDGCVRTDTGRTQTMHPDLLWQIEAALSEGCIQCKTGSQVWFGSRIERSKYQHDEVVNKAEEEHVLKKYGYQSLVASAKKPSVAWEDDERVFGRKSRR